MSNGYAQLDAMIAQLRGLDTMREEIAKEAAPLVEQAARATAAAGTDPEGKPWAPKKDGSRALVGVERNITAKALGTLVQVVLSGGAVWWQNSKGKKDRVQRRVIPDSGAGVPSHIADALVRAAQRVWARRMGR